MYGLNYRNVKIFLELVLREFPVSGFNSDNNWNFGSAIISLNNLSQAAWRFSSRFSRLNMRDCFIIRLSRKYNSHRTMLSISFLFACSPPRVIASSCFNTHLTCTRLWRTSNKFIIMIRCYSSTPNNPHPQFCFTSYVATATCLLQQGWPQQQLY